MLLLNCESNEPEYTRQHPLLCHGDSTVGRASMQRRQMAAWYLVISTMYFQLKVKGKGMFLYSAVSGPYDCSKRFTLHPLVDLFIPRPSQLLWEVFSHAVVAARRLLVHISTTVCIARYSFIQLSGNVG